MNVDFLDIGDLVEVIGDEKFKAGTVGTVVAFGETFNTHRWCVGGKKPGRYRNMIGATIRCGDSEHFVHTGYLKAVDEAKYKERQSKDPDNLYGGNLRIGDLPETPFWEGDVIQHKKYGWPHGVVQVDIINYGWSQDGRIPFQLTSVGCKGMSSCGRYEWEDYDLWHRGRPWKFWHGEKIEFESLEDETAFAISIGQYKEVRNPNTGIYPWDEDSHIEVALKSGLIDGIRPGYNRFGAIKFIDTDLGDRARKRILQEVFND